MIKVIKTKENRLMSYEIPSPADVRNELEKRRKEREKSPLVKVALHITNTYLTEMAIELAVKKMMSRAENVLVNPLLSEAVAELLDEPKYFSAEQIEKIREEIRADAKVDYPREVLQKIEELLRADMRSWFAFKRQLQETFEEAGYATEGTPDMKIIHPELMIEKFTLI